MTANGVGTCGADDNQAQAGHLIAYAPDIAATLSHGSARQGVSAPGRRQEDDHNLIVTALTTRAGSTFDDQQVGQLVVGVLGEHSHTLTAEGADASEDGTGRGTPVVSIDMRNAARSSGTGAGTQGTGIATDGTSYGLSATSRAIPAVAYPLAVRGRDALHEGQESGNASSDLIGGAGVSSVIVRRLTPL